jgi:low affinity Fe/Cu permease
MTIRERFNCLAQATAHWTGSVWAFLLAFATVAVWAVCGPFTGYSDLWQLTINTGTTIVTFLMVFLIQASQNRDGAAIQAKLDELIRSSNARNDLIGIEKKPETEL